MVFGKVDMFLFVMLWVVVKIVIIGCVILGGVLFD